MALLTVSTSSEWMTIVRYILGALLFGALFLVVKVSCRPGLLLQSGLCRSEKLTLWFLAISQAR